MANKEQLAILEQGVAVWNKWREEHPDVKINLRGAKLDKKNLSGANFRKADIRGTSFRKAIFIQANFTEAVFGYTIIGKIIHIIIQPAISIIIVVFIFSSFMFGIFPLVLILVAISLFIDTLRFFQRIFNLFQRKDFVLKEMYKEYIVKLELCVSSIIWS